MIRHKWSEPDRRPLATIRRCLVCDLVKLTRHEPNVLPWTEWVRDCEKIQTGGNTPPCLSPVAVQAIAGDDLETGDLVTLQGPPPVAIARRVRA